MALIRRDSGVKATIVQNLSSKFESDFIRGYHLLGAERICLLGFFPRTPDPDRHRRMALVQVPPYHDLPGAAGVEPLRRSLTSRPAGPRLPRHAAAAAAAAGFHWQT
jgi:hypothetical protein